MGQENEYETKTAIASCGGALGPYFSEEAEIFFLPFRETLTTHNSMFLFFMFLFIA